MPGLFFPPLAGLDGFQRRNFLLVYVLPNFFIYLQPDCGLLIRVVPLAAGRCAMAADVLLPAATRNLPDYGERLERLVAFFERFNEEDTPVNTANSSGSSSVATSVASMMVLSPCDVRQMRRISATCSSMR